MRLDVPKFNEVYLDGWIFAINEYFELLETTPEQRLRIIGFNLEGDVAECLQLIKLLLLAIKWISPTERQKRLNNRLCFNCDNKWMRGHKCPGKFLLLMADEGDDPGREIPANPAYYLEDKVISEGERMIRLRIRGKMNKEGHGCLGMAHGFCD
ncbi:hypothetical protein Tco_1299643 [Tanacetum coccineum]